MIRFVGLALSCTAILPMPAHSQASAQELTPPGFELPVFAGKYPGKTFVFDGREAKRLTREVLPVLTDDVTRASVREDLMLPVSVHSGFTIDFTVGMEAFYSGSVCEERHAFVAFRYVGPDPGNSELRLTVNDGAVANHKFAGLYWSNRYTTLPEKASSQEAALASCRSLAADTSGWKTASNADRYVSEVRRLSALVDAVQSLPAKTMDCLDPDGKSYRCERSKLLSLFQKAPSELAESISVPGEGTSSIYHHWGYYDDTRLDYAATLRLDMAGRPVALTVRFSHSPAPPQV